jgi:hypothetical protein
MPAIEHLLVVKSLDEGMATLIAERTERSLPRLRQCTNTGCPGSKKEN